MSPTTRALGRTVLRKWAGFGIAPGLRYVGIERFGPRLGERGGLTSLLANGCRVRCDVTDHVQRQMFFLGVYEPPEAFVFTRLLERGMTVIDAGANIGQYTLLAATATGPQGRVHAFEPVPANFNRLRQHVHDNGLANVVLNRTALWSHPTRLDLGLDPEEANNAGCYSVAAAGRPGAVATEAIALDDYVASNNIARVDLMKIDIEGAELPALRGAQRTLRRFKPLLLMEINRAACRAVGYEPEEVGSFLAETAGYRAWAIGESAQTCRPLADLRGVALQNVLFHTSDLPPSVTGGWNLRSVLRWAQRAGDGR